MTARLPAFAVVSGCGWMLDFLLTAGLVATGAPAAAANAVGATCGVTFVFFAAQRRVFVTGDRVLVRPLLAYLGYQAGAIALASAAIGLLASVLAAPSAAVLGAVVGSVVGPDAPGAATLAAAAAKVAVTPATLYANFLFTGWLLEGRVSWR
jgi:putative flippase GtrA